MTCTQHISGLPNTKHSSISQLLPDQHAINICDMHTKAHEGTLHAKSMVTPTSQYYWTGTYGYASRATSCSSPCS